MPKEFRDFANYLVPDLLDFCMSWEEGETVCDESYLDEEFFFSPRFNGVDVKNTPLLGDCLSSFIAGSPTAQKLSVLLDIMELLVRERHEKT